MSLSPDQQRFLRKVQKTNRCWLWTGGRQPRGYGGFVLNGKKIGAHVASYLLFVGEIPDGQEIDHKCNVPQCVRPSHLRPMTRSDNLKRIQEKECRKGHKRTKRNTYIRPNGRRECLDCKRSAWQSWKNDKKENATT